MLAIQSGLPLTLDSFCLICAVELRPNKRASNREGKRESARVRAREGERERERESERERKNARARAICTCGGESQRQMEKKEEKRLCGIRRRVNVCV